MAIDCLTMSLRVVGFVEALLADNGTDRRQPQAGPADVDDGGAAEKLNCHGADNQTHSTDVGRVVPYCSWLLVASHAADRCPWQQKNGSVAELKEQKSFLP